MSLNEVIDSLGDSFQHSLELLWRRKRLYPKEIVGCQLGRAMRMLSQRQENDINPASSLFTLVL